MTIDLNKILDMVRPKPMTMTLGDRTYKLRRLTVADAAVLGEVGKPVEGEAPIDADQRVANFLRQLFDGDAPPFVPADLKAMDEDAREAALVECIALLQTITKLFEEVSDWNKPGNRNARVREEAQRQIEAARAMTTISAPSTT